jgi:AcrR family transcriptional regulator
VPPRGLTQDKVVEAAGALADRDGLHAVTLSAVAAEVGVRTPSLYNHVEGLPGLRRDLALRAVGELGDRLRRATVGLSGGPAVHALSAAYLTFASAHPGLYAATVAAPAPDDTELRDLTAEVVDVVVRVLDVYGLDGDDAIHAVRTLRACLHGFVLLVQAGGFGLDVEVDASVRWAVEGFVSSLGPAG